MPWQSLVQATSLRASRVDNPPHAALCHSLPVWLVCLEQLCSLGRQPSFLFLSAEWFCVRTPHTQCCARQFYVHARWPRRTAVDSPRGCGAPPVACCCWPGGAMPARCASAQLAGTVWTWWWWAEVRRAWYVPGVPRRSATLLRPVCAPTQGVSKTWRAVRRLIVGLGAWGCPTDGGLVRCGGGCECHGPGAHT